MTIFVKFKAAQAALNALLDTENIHVNSEVGDAVLPIISELDEAEKLAAQLSSYYKLNRRELGAVLAGLRLLQCEIPFDGNIPTQINTIFNDMAPSYH